MRTRRGSAAFSGKTLLAFAIIMGGTAYVYLPMYWDYWAMRTIVRDVVEEWKHSKRVDHSKDMMIRAMKRKEVSTDVSDNACHFMERKNSLRVECGWVGYSFIPLVDKTVTRDFSLTVSAESEGAIEIY